MNNHIFEFYAYGIKREQYRMIAQVRAKTLDNAINIVCDATGKTPSFLLGPTIYWVMRLDGQASTTETAEDLFNQRKRK